MKKTLKNRLTALTLTAALVLSLAACGAAPSEGASAAANPMADPSGVAGTVLLSVNPEIEMNYDDDGNVVTLAALNDDGQAVLNTYTGYEGKACTAVIGELVNQIDAGGYFDTTVAGQERNIVLKLERGSAYPNEAFLNELADAVRAVVEAGQIGSRTVALDEDDYDDAYGEMGYISAQAAQALLSAQLNRDDVRFVEQEYELEDGEYEMEFVLDGVEYAFEVNALTGKITEMDAEFADYDDTDYGEGSDGATDYGMTDYDDTDYGPAGDGVTDYNDTDYGPAGDGVTDFSDTDYGPTGDGVTDYSDTDYGPAGDGVTDFSDTDYGPAGDGVTDYSDTDYGPTGDGVTDYSDTDYGDTGGSDYGDSDYDD